MSPSLNDGRKIIETTIEGIPGSKVVLWDSLTIGDTEKIMEVEGDSKRGIETLRCLIKEWNLDEELSSQSIRQLDVSCIEALLGKTSLGKKGKLSVEEKEEEEEAEKKS